MKTSITLPLAAAVAVAAPLAQATGHVLSNARLSVTFADTAVFAFPDADRVDAITWIDSQGNARSNYVAAGGPSHCGDPQEFFGQSYGEPEGTSPGMVFGGVVDTRSGTGKHKGTAATSLTGFYGELGRLPGRLRVPVAECRGQVGYDLTPNKAALTAQ